MTYTLFAAIDVGSYELEMKIYQIEKKNKITTIDTIRHVIEIGKDTYTTGKVSNKNIDELCRILKGFMDIIKEYRIKSYTAYATSAIREAGNWENILDRIRVSTGLEVKILSNSEQRFLGYKALSVNEDEFEKKIKDTTAIVDIGDGSIQISLFDKNALVTTQNIKLGSLRIRELLYDVSDDRNRYCRLIEELVNNDIQTFKRIYLKDKTIKNIIAIGDYIGYIARIKNIMTRKQFLEQFDILKSKSIEYTSEKMSITEEQASLLLPCMIVYKKLFDETETENIWIPGVDVCDGIVAEYGIMTGKLAFRHDFQEDIICTARVLAKKYRANKAHTELVESNAVKIFDAIKKYHGLGKRERLLLQISAILHDCGKYISMSSPAECSYNIIMSTEIIGLSHEEREVVANVVKYNTMELPENGREKNSMLIVKLTAILRVANAMDRSHKQKIREWNISVKDNKLVFTIVGNENIILEQVLFGKKAELFEEIYGLCPVLKQKVVH